MSASSASTARTPAHPGTTTKQKVGLVIAALYSLTNIPSVLFETPEGQAGPPLAILAVGSILGVIGLVAAVWAWHGNPVALRVAAGAIILVTLTALPAFFVDVPMAIKALVAFSVVLILVAVVLMFSANRRPASVTD
jgi:hypothetical protein